MGFLSDLFPNTQFIVSAHSPLVVQAATDANVVLLRREGDHVVIDNDVQAIKGWRVDQVLTSDLFSLESARPPQLDAALKERTHLLSKARLTAKDRTRLHELEAQIGALPTGETPQDIEAVDQEPTLSTNAEGRQLVMEAKAFLAAAVTDAGEFAAMARAAAREDFSLSLP
jgi:hypothetical protein